MKVIPRRYPTPRHQWIEVAHALRDQGATFDEIVSTMQITPPMARSLLGVGEWRKP